MPISPTEIESIMKLGAQGVLFLCMAIAIKVLWKMVTEKDSQIIQERDKREDLIKESIKASSATLESTERILEILQRLEAGALLNARSKN